MYVNMIDSLFDGVINKLHTFLESKKAFKRFAEDQNFVKYMNDIVEMIRLFINEINMKEIETLIASKSHVKYIVEVIKRYCAFYIYLGIAFYYKGDRDLYITNIIETSKNVKDGTFSISNFYNSENNAKIITMYTIVKDIIKLKEYKTIERVKIILNNEPIRFGNTINLLNSIGEDYFNTYFMADDHFHNILKTLIFRQIYLLEEKNEIIKLLEESELQEAEYKYIDIVVSKEEKLIDFTFLQNIIQQGLSRSELFKSNLANEYYEFLEDHKKEQELRIIGNTKMIDFLLTNRILIPISDDFLRYHKNTEKYDKDITGELKERDATKIKYIMNKMNRVMNMYSNIYEKNQKLKLEAMNLFYKSLEYKDAILYNDLEEIKIVTKLSASENTTDLDYLVDLENMRSYAYLNYKDFSKDGFRFRPSIPTQTVRMSNIKHKTPKNRPLELRVGHGDLPLNIVGLVFNPTGKMLECLDVENLKSIRDINKNGYDALIQLMEENKKSSNLYYWLFDTKLDKVKLEQYKNVSSLDGMRIVENTVAEIFNNYMDITRNTIFSELRKKKPDNMYEAMKIIRKHQASYRYTVNIPVDFNYELLGKYMDTVKDMKVKEPKEKEKDIFKIPTTDYIKKKDETVVLGLKEIDINLESITTQPICNHYIRWMQLGKISRKNDEELNQAIFDFVKQYVKTNEKGEYECKSCSELLDLKKYVYEGTYVAELDTFLTTNLAVNSKLESIPKYTKYTRSIRNIEKNIEKLCYAMNLSYYIGNTPTIKLRRKMIIKDVIDMVLIHTEYLKNQPKDRVEKAVATYNIHKDLTNLFFFELKDEIFLTSSTDTDYYKLIKYNNIIAYIILMLIADINIGQIISFKDDKRCNFFIYSQIGTSIFSNLYLRLNEKEKIAISNIPLLAYVIYYFACVVSNNYIWLWNSANKSESVINVQKIIIHTMVDLLNTMIEANMSKDKNFQYELIVNRLMHKIKNTYMDMNAYNMIDEQMKQKIRVDSTTNKISYVSKKEKIIDLNNNDVEFKPIIHSSVRCLSKEDKLEKVEHTKFDYDIDIFTNCPDGKFHEWDYKNKGIICNLCGAHYSDLLKEKHSSSGNISRVNMVKSLYLRKLANTYCISGEIHDIDINTNICSRCKINVAKHEYTSEELFKLEKNLKKFNENKAITQLNNIRKHFEKIERKREHDMKIMVTLNERYNKYTNGKIVNYIDDFIDMLILNVGTKIKSEGMAVHLKDTTYIIKNDYLGNSIKNSIVIMSSEDKIQYMNDHPFYKRNVLFYNDKVHGAYVFYDALTKNYLGYSRDNRKFEQYKSNMYIEVVHSIRDMLLNMGLEHEYYNINHLNKGNHTNSNNNNEDMIRQIIRLRCNNLKHIIQRTNSIIEKVNNTFPNKMNPYNMQEFNLVGEFQKSLKHFTTNHPDHGPIFKHLYTITNNPSLKELPEKLNITVANNYINMKVLQKLNNTDSLLLFYYVMNMFKLIEYNEQPAIRTNITFLLVRIIQYCYSMYYTPLENSQVRKFDSILSIEAPYIDESLRVVGYYQELVNVKEIDEEANKEKEQDMNEENNALDLDEYDENDLYEDGDPNEDVVENLMNYDY